MGFSEPPSRARGGRARPVAPVTAGVRKRGRSGKLTPFIAIQAPTASGWFLGGGDMNSSPMLLLIGEGADRGKIAITRCEPAKSNITLRRPAPASTEFIIESTMIPYGGSQPLKRKEVQFESSEAGMIITLPWGLPRLKGEL